MAWSLYLRFAICPGDPGEVLKDSRKEPAAPLVGGGWHYI